MKTKHSFHFAASCLLVIIALGWSMPLAMAAGNSGAALTRCDPNRAPAVLYRLVEGSTLVDECTICGRPTIQVPIRGSFWLRLIRQDMWFRYFAVRGFRFKSTVPQMGYTGRLDGRYEIGGDFALVHEMTLHGRINEFEDLRFDSGVVLPQLGFPWIEIDLQQVRPTDPFHTFSMHIVAVPWPALWFSTEEGFHASSPTRIAPLYISDGDLLGCNGRVIRTNQQLTSRLGIMPIVPDIGLDAVTRLMLPLRPDIRRPEIWFSAEQDIFSETLGPLRHGDLLSDAGRVVHSYRDLIAPFSPMPPVADYGLDAVTVGPDGLLLFSTEESFFSESLGETIDDGDILLEGGRIFRRIGDLMSKFQPIEPRPIRFGLDAVYVWPHGEIWFSIEDDFADGRFGHIGHGDLLSNTGRVVARNRELVGPFEPTERLADFGLDGLHILWPRIAADFDFDGDVDNADFAIFALSWLAESQDDLWHPECDISIPADDSVNILDLAVFAEDWQLSDQ